MIAVGGFKVFPSEVEKVLYHHPAVMEALVIGIPDHYRGDCPKAFVTLQDGSAIDGAALKNWLNPQLGKHETVSAENVRASCSHRVCPAVYTAGVSGSVKKKMTR